MRRRSESPRVLLRIFCRDADPFAEYSSSPPPMALLCLAGPPARRGPADHRQAARSPPGGDDRALCAFLSGLGQEILRAHRAQHRPGSLVGTVPFRLPGSVRRVSPGLVIVPRGPSSGHGTEEGKEWQANVGPSPSGWVMMSTAPAPGGSSRRRGSPSVGTNMRSNERGGGSQSGNARRARSAGVPLRLCFCGSDEINTLAAKAPDQPAAQKRAFAFGLRRCGDVHPARFEPAKSSDQCGNHGNAVQDKHKNFRLSVVLRRRHILDLT